MKVTRYLLLLLLVWVPTAAIGEILPTFNSSCAGRSTDIAVVETLAADDGTFQIVEVWHGPLKTDAIITMPDLSGIAKGKMVLFLIRDECKEKGEAWRPAGRDFKTSVVWIKGDAFTAIQQPRNPGPAYKAKVPFLPTVHTLQERVQQVLESKRLLKAAEDAEHVKERVELCSQIIDGNYLYKDKAISLLAKCGEPAVSVLRRYVNGQPISHQRVQAIPAFVEAAGPPVLIELNEMLEAELAYWTKTAPDLEKGWWFDSSDEDSIRHSRVSQLAVVFSKHLHPPALTTLISLRDLFRNTPAIEDDDRIGRVSESLDIAITSHVSKD
ncbi:MAG: hypothetical protein AAF085_13220 [Planctomycetota bacterium]